jgi:hypothetical protein
MAKIRLEKRRSSMVVLQLFGALGFVVAAGCGSSDSPGGAKKDTSVSGEVQPSGIKYDVPPASSEVQPETRVVTEPGIDGAVVRLDVAPPDVPNPLDVPADVPAGETGPSRPEVQVGEAGQGTGGVRGTGGAAGAGGGIAGATGTGIDGGVGGAVAGATGAGGRTGAGGTAGTTQGTGGSAGAAGTTHGTGGAAGAAGTTQGAGGAAGAGTGGAAGAAGATGVGGATGAGGGTAVAGVLTGWPAGTVHYFGTGGSADVPASVTCTGAPQTAPGTWAFTLSNASGPGNAVVDIAVTGSGYSVNPSGVRTIVPGASLSITVTPPTAAYPTVPATLSGALTITTNAATDNVHTYSLREIIHGSLLAWGSGAVDTTLGGIAPAGTLSTRFRVSNSGDTATTIRLSSSDATNYTILPCDSTGLVCNAQAPIAPTTDIAVAAATTLAFQLVFRAPASEGTYETHIHMTLPTEGANSCGAQPADWTVSALSLNAFPRLTPAGGTTIFFTGACGSAAIEQTVMVENIGTAPMRWRYGLARTNDPCFEIVPTPSNENLTMPVSASSTLTIRMLQGFAANGQQTCSSNTLNLTYIDDSVGSVQVNYPLVITPLGDRLTFDPTSAYFVDNYTTDRADRPAQSMTLTVNNLGLIPDEADPVNPTNTTAQVTLNLSNPHFSFGATESVSSTSITVIGGQAFSTVQVYYILPLTGSTQGQQESGTVTWTVPEGERTCMTGSREGVAATLYGTVYQGSVVADFTPDRRGDNFGTVYCGAQASRRTFRVAQAVSDGSSFQIGPYGLLNGAYYDVSGPAEGTVVDYTHPAYFTITPRILPANAVTTNSDLGTGSERFFDTLSITTTAPGGPGSTDITQVLRMYAQGVIVNSISSLAWTNYPAINWPQAPFQTSDVENVDNQGDVDAYAYLTTTPGGNDVFHLLQSPTTLAPTARLGNNARLESTFGGPTTPFSRCDLDALDGIKGYNNTGYIQIIADLGNADEFQELNPDGGNGRVGICGTTEQLQYVVATTVCTGGASTCGAYRRDLSFTATVQTTPGQSMCAFGQHCDSGPPAGPVGSGTGLCLCDSTSCGGIGCCTMIGAGGICHPYAEQSPYMDADVASHRGCGRFTDEGLGGVCAQCADVTNATCSEGGCGCSADPVGGGARTYCGDWCRNLATDENNCGSCYAACSAAGLNGPPSCEGSTCVGECDGDHGDCNGDLHNGCETNIRNGDATNCGGCGNACVTAPAQIPDHVTSQACTEYQCVPSCDANWGTCPNTNDNLRNAPCNTDLTNYSTCGSCDVNCGVGHGNTYCHQNEAGAYQCLCGGADFGNSCPNGCCSARVDGTCYLIGQQSEVLNSELHGCGNSGNICAGCTGANESCQDNGNGGVCRCDVHTCGSGCCDTSGVCHEYSTAPNCMTGEGGAACPATLTDCRTTCLDDNYVACIQDPEAPGVICGCQGAYPDSCDAGGGTYHCYNTQSDRDHCGSCTNACPGNQICQGGACVNPEN